MKETPAREMECIERRDRPEGIEIEHNPEMISGEVARDIHASGCKAESSAESFRSAEFRWMNIESPTTLLPGKTHHNRLPPFRPEMISPISGR